MKATAGPAQRRQTQHTTGYAPREYPGQEGLAATPPQCTPDTKSHRSPGKARQASRCAPVQPTLRPLFELPGTSNSTPLSALGSI